MAKRKKIQLPRRYKINYIRKRTPSFKVLPFKGQRYQAWVPDTLDIQERIVLAVNGLTRATDAALPGLLATHRRVVTAARPADAI